MSFILNQLTSVNFDFIFFKCCKILFLESVVSLVGFDIFDGFSSLAFKT